MKTISVIIPCYNEEESLPIYFQEIDKIIKNDNFHKYDFILVNDGSKDNTLEVMDELYLNRDDITVISLSRNFGQNPAFIAGLNNCISDYCILMDADLQDPLSVIPEIVKKFDEGFDVVNPYRENRDKDSFFKRKTASLFYKLVNKLEGKNVIPENINCFRGLSKRAIEKINSLTEKDKFLLLEIPLVGFKTCSISFKRDERKVGESKYNVKKMTRYALDNISSITSSPLYCAIKFGFVSLILSSLYFITMIILFILAYPTINIISHFYLINTLFIISIILLCFSIIICFIGILSLYTHNILVNTRNRPTYIIDTIKKPSDKN